jgi:hypothetical protein
MRCYWLRIAAFRIQRASLYRLLQAGHPEFRSFPYRDFQVIHPGRRQDHSLRPQGFLQLY